MIKDFSTPHTLDTPNPQNYWVHGWFALTNSLKLIKYGFAGIIHAFFPEIKCFQFYTSSGILRMAKGLEVSRRHDKEIENIWGLDRVMVVKYFRDSR